MPVNRHTSDMKNQSPHSNLISQHDFSSPFTKCQLCLLYQVLDAHHLHTTNCVDINVEKHLDGQLNSTVKQRSWLIDQLLTVITEGVSRCAVLLNVTWYAMSLCFSEYCNNWDLLSSLNLCTLTVKCIQYGEYKSITITSKKKVCSLNLIVPH